MIAKGNALLRWLRKHSSRDFRPPPPEHYPEDVPTWARLWVWRRNKWITYQAMLREDAGTFANKETQNAT